MRISRCDILDGSVSFGRRRNGTAANAKQGAEQRMLGASASVDRIRLIRSSALPTSTSTTMTSC
jgi:hypothetical protein